MAKIPVLNKTFYQTMMLKIDFYLTKHSSFQANMPFLCSLIGHKFADNSNMSVLFSEMDILSAFDLALWTSSVTSFLPHQVNNAHKCITISHPGDNNIDTQCNMQVDQTHTLPNISHLIQIVPNNESDKQQARQLYRHFQQLGHQIIIHKDA